MSVASDNTSDTTEASAQPLERALLPPLLPQGQLGLVG